jgi:hypothetical protein
MSFTIKASHADLGLCALCAHAEIVSGDTEMQRAVGCTNLVRATQRQIRWPVRSCSGYEERGKPSQFELERIAWILEVKRGKRIGFASPLERRRKKMEADD